MSENVWRSDAAKTDAALTRATPIISAAAVAEVRRGDRPAFSRASTPGVLNALAIGQPIALVAGLATVEDTLATPRNISRAPTPARVSRPTVPPGRTNSPTTKAMAPTSETIEPTIKRLALSASNPSSGFIAATGGTRAARTAGMITEAIVIPTPTTNAITTVRGRSTVVTSGNPAPAALKMLTIPLATKMPATMPTMVATTDVTRAST